jgi:hypothetical protein
MRYFPIEDNSEIDIRIKIPLEVYKLYQCRLTGLGVSSRESPHYVKWVRYYLDFEVKYGGGMGAPKMLVLLSQSWRVRGNQQACAIRHVRP